MSSSGITTDDDEPLSEYRARLRREYRARLQQESEKPLIAQVNNQWKTDGWEEEKYRAYVEQADEVGFCDLDDEQSCPNVSANVIASRRFRRMFALVLILALALYYAWRVLLEPPTLEDWAYREGFVNQDTPKGNGTYGIARGGDIDDDMIRLQDLDMRLLPGGDADPEGKRRLVFVGDVHGCKKELKKLLKEVQFHEETDHLILVGDVISKGPDNVGVLDELIRLNATSVRGNHEDRVLQTQASAHVEDEGTMSSKGLTKDLALLKKLKPHHLDYLRSMPLMLHVPALPNALSATKKDDSPISQHILVVHAGVVPGVPFARQDPYYIMNMRSMDRRTHVPSSLRAAKNAKHVRPWFDVWNWYNDRIFRKKSLARFNDAFDPTAKDEEEVQDGTWYALWKNFWGDRKARPKPQVVIYGHDSKTGSQLKRWSKGLDSACVSGGELTALVLDARGQQEIVSVKCKNYRA